jgi:hypothetical protein
VNFLSSTYSPQPTDLIGIQEMDVMIHADIWRIIASFLESSRSSLSRLSRSSKTMAQIIRPVLFKTVDLSSWNSNHDGETVLQTLLLLSGHNHFSDLTHFVRTLHLPRFEIYKPEVQETLSQASMDAIHQTKSLQSLILSSLPYCSRHGQELFINALRTLDAPLRRLHAERWIDYGIGEQDGCAFSSALEQVSCDAWFPFDLCKSQAIDESLNAFDPPSDNPIYQSIKASQNTLRQLKLPLQIVSAEGNDKCQFWQLRFPSLTRLEIGRWDSFPSGPLGSVTDFFLYHSDKIESVIFRYLTGESIDVRFTNAHGQLHLQSLKADAANMSELVNDSMPHIAPSLRILHLRPGIDDVGSFFQQHFVELLATIITMEESEDGIFPSLQELSVTLTWTKASDDRSNPSPAHITNFIRGISALAGRNLRRFSFFAPYMTVEPEELSSAISLFPYIVHLTLYDSIIQEGLSEFDHARELAKRCPQLKEVKFTIWPPANEFSIHSSDPADEGRVAAHVLVEDLIR